jgi:hypothetical protein
VLQAVVLVEAPCFLVSLEREDADDLRDTQRNGHRVEQQLTSDVPAWDTSVTTGTAVNSLRPCLSQVTVVRWPASESRSARLRGK